MSLLVWLPLTDNTENQGLLSLPTPWESRSKETGGKIGQYCYTDRAIYHLTDEPLNNQWSIACWVKSTSWSVNNDIIICKNSSESTNCQFYFSIINGASLNLGINGGAGNGAGSQAYTFSTNTWYHVAATYDGSNYAMYVNGEKIKSGTYSSTMSTGLLNLCIGCKSTNAAGTSSTGNANKRLNDVRIYDEALSPLEIKRLSQGLVVHYPLNNNGLGNENIALNTQNLNITSAKTNKYCYKRGTSTLVLRSDGFYEAKCTASWAGLSVWANQFNFAVGDKLTYSFYIYGNGSTRAFSFYPMMFDSGGTRDTSTGIPISLDGGTYTTVNAKAFTSCSNIIPERHYVTFEWNSAVKAIIDNGGSIELSIQVHGTWSTGDWVCVFAPKLEYGEKPTPYTLSSSDYSDNIIVYDCSGYNRNLTTFNSPTISPDAPRYSASTQFNGSNQLASSTTVRTGLVGDCALTMSAWIYWDLDSWRSDYVGIFGNNTYSTNAGIWMLIYNGRPDFDTWNQRYIATNSISVKTWHHIVIVKEPGALSTTTKIYVDGALVAGSGTTTNAPNYVDNGIFIARSSNSAARHFPGKISDVRLYATALSADDVKALYEDSAYIASNGTGYAYEFVEG